MPSLRGTCARSRMGIQLFFPITLGAAPCALPPGWKQPEYTLTHYLLLRCSLDSVARARLPPRAFVCCAFVISSWCTFHLFCIMLHSRLKKTMHCIFFNRVIYGIIIDIFKQFLRRILEELKKRFVYKKYS